MSLTSAAIDRLRHLALVLGWAATAAGAEAQTGTVRGTVFDSTSLEYLADAAVVLWNTPYRTATDEDGRFTLAEVPPGEYNVVFYHARLGELGVSTGPVPISLAAGAVREVELATPSPFTLLTSECLFEEALPRTGVLAGWVGDPESGTGMPGAEVTLSWTPEGERLPVERILTANLSGWYRSCQVPSGVPIVAWASFLNRAALRREVRVPEGGAQEEAFHLTPLASTDISGRLVDATSGDPVAHADVRLRSTKYRGLSGPDGRFSFDDVPPGSYMLVSEHLGYGTKMDTLAVPSGVTINVEMRLDTEPIEIAPITVSVAGSPLTRSSGGGLTITREAIEKIRMRAHDVGDILRLQNLSGIIVRRQGASLCVGFSQGQVRFFRNDCEPALVFIDGVRASNQDLSVQLNPDAIDHITIYRPVEAGNLFGLGSGNGVIAIFTRMNR